jgi:hypothetical protein
MTVVVLATPPFWLATAITLAISPLLGIALPELLQFERGWALIYGVITPKRSGATSKCGANFLTMLARLTT